MIDPTQSKEIPVVQPEVSPVRTIENPKTQTRVNTLGFRLEVENGVTITPEQQADWEMTFLAGSLLRARLHKVGITDGVPETGAEHTRAARKDLEHVFLNEIMPTIRLLQKIPLNDLQTGPSLEAMQERIHQLQGFLDAETLLYVGDQRTVVISAQNHEDIQRLIDTWRHDFLGTTTSPMLRAQMLGRLRQRLGEGALSDPDFQAKREVFLQGTESSLARMNEILEQGLPFTRGEEFAQPRELFPKSPVNLDTLSPLITKAVAVSGQQLNLHVDPTVRKMGPTLQVNWDPDLARRLVENIISNAQKAHIDSDVDPSSRMVDVFIGIVNGQLSLVFGDRAKGYSQNMIDLWEDPARRSAIPTGWQKKDIPTGGIGFRDHAKILEEHYQGKVDIFNWSPQGGAATVVTLPLINPPAAEVVKAES